MSTKMRSKGRTAFLVLTLSKQIQRGRAGVHAGDKQADRYQEKNRNR